MESNGVYFTTRLSTVRAGTILLAVLAPLPSCLLRKLALSFIYLTSVF